MDVLNVLGTEVKPMRERKPPWFKVPPPGGAKYIELRNMIREENLHTVCQEAACPNVGECWERGTATFMILGDTCTRRCGFCHVRTGKPTWNDPLEPARVARSIATMGLRHAVVTSVDRDDLPDYGAGIWAATIRQIRAQSPETKIEVLTPDFRGVEMPLARVLDAGPDVFNHNVEVVPRLYSVARRGSTWQRSLRVLENAKLIAGDAVTTKSGLMVGLGEERACGLDARGGHARDFVRLERGQGRAGKRGGFGRQPHDALGSLGHQPLGTAGADRVSFLASSLEQRRIGAVALGPVERGLRDERSRGGLCGCSRLFKRKHDCGTIRCYSGVERRNNRLEQGQRCG
jgi:lipoate synthase